MNMMRRNAHWINFAVFSALTWVILEIAAPGAQSAPTVEFLGLVLGSVALIPIIGEAGRIYPKAVLPRKQQWATGWLDTLKFICTSIQRVMMVRIETYNVDWPVTREQYEDLEQWYGTGAALIEKGEISLRDQIDQWLARYNSPMSQFPYDQDG